MSVARQRLVARVWVRYKRTRTECLRNFLIEHYLPLVQQHAQRMSAKLPRSVNTDELVSAGTLGLMDAIESFDPALGNKFETYCSRRISGAILDELRSIDMMSRLLRQRARKLSSVTQQLWSELGRRPSDQEMADGLQMSMPQYRQFLRTAVPPSLHPLSASRDPENPELDSVGIIADQRAADPAHEAQRHTLKELITRGLSRAERLIVLLYYYEGLTQEQIGEALDLSESRVCQMHKLVLKRLQAHLADRIEECEAA